ncbi:SAM-dependent methyltransferase [Heliobacterium undosum]|uniref:S-adenosyl-L-methionine-dependent methyltransferase n=1 Tax=Heliomicrobium undosum TaxID=121734 RepID=A0A845KXY0_9FIRM|nr:class I SAM-dependent methyltransferase [Heliomicrobium undosum]MZP28567.1 SAM-dependent methyltransferase [Heliomicrobium undosum]
MTIHRSSITALMSAYVRAYHSKRDANPIFDDFFAERLFTVEERSSIESNLVAALPFFDPERVTSCPDADAALSLVIRAMNATTVISRARYTEDVLAKMVHEGVQQYVILGAGMDTFALRRSDMLGQIEVFELDHPATQADKRRRLERAGVSCPERLHFIPIDFTTERLPDALNRSRYSPEKSTLFSWLGVTYYLTGEEVLRALRDIATLSPGGSAIIFDYMDADALDPRKASMRMQKVQAIAGRSGEPMKTGFDPRSLAEDLAKTGLLVKENLCPADIEERYFRGRIDGCHAFEHVHFAWAVVA